MPLSVWAENYFYLSAESSYTEGKWVAYPYQRGVLDMFGNDDIEDIDVRKSARTGYTKMLLAALAYFTVFKKRNQAIWQPTDSDAKEFVETEYNTMLRDCTPIKKIFPALGKKHSHNTNSYKKFIGCVTYIKGAATARSFRRISIDVAATDETDSFDKDIDGEGSPRKLAKKRTEGATFPKRINGSTPKIKYISEIDAAIEEADSVFTYRVPCPHCRKRQALEFGGKDKNYGLKFTNNDPDTAAYLCIDVDCAALFTQAEYLTIWGKGRWEDQHGNWYCDETHKFMDYAGAIIRAPKHVGIDNLWAIYSPQTTWSQIIKEFLAATKKATHGDLSDLKTFINTTLGQSFEETSEKTDASDLEKQAEDYPLRIIPMGGLIIFVGVDVQKDRFELVFWVFGRGEEMWVVDYVVIEANPAIESEWKKLDPYLLHNYRHASGTLLSVERAGIDTGGHWTHECYNYIRDRQSSRGWDRKVPPKVFPKVYATKGSSTHGIKISGKSSLQDISRFNKVIKRGIRLFLIGTESAKNLIFNRMQTKAPGPGYMHMSKHLPVEFFQHMTNEVRVIKRTTKGEISTWVPKRSGARNECLDCTVMVLFCADKASLQNKTQREWDLLESIIQPSQNDIFAVQPEIEEQSTDDIDVIPVNAIASQQNNFYIPD